MACEETISETAMPAPKRLACSRTNQLPMPASGASITRLGTRSVPSCQLSSRRGVIGPSLGVALVQQTQAGEREQVVDLVDLLGVRHDQPRQAARGDHVGALA